MADALAIASDNLTSVAVLSFVLGFLGSQLKSDLKLPESVYLFISMYLLFGIGLKGGHALLGVEASSFAQAGVLTLVAGTLIPILAFVTLRMISTLSAVDRGSIAAHYGSTSLITFSAAIIFLETNSITFEGYVIALLVLMEIPGLVVGIYLGSRNLTHKTHWRATLLEVLGGKTVLLLVGGLVIGLVSGEAGYAKVTPFFVDMQSGLLSLFLLHLGFIAGSNVEGIRSVGMKVFLFAILFPVFVGAIGVVAATFLGMSTGGATIFAVLCASASYIAAPAAVSIGLPKANSSIALFSSLAITFPFNLILGIPIFFEVSLLISASGLL